MTQVPILTYHANNIEGMDYHNNDHIALIEDLKMIHQSGFKIITLDYLMKWYTGQLSDSAVENTVVLTCDDGTNFDFYDIDHPRFGPQLSFLSILKNHQQQTGQQVHITDFVIVSPSARKILDQECLVGKGWWEDDWWLDAQNSGFIHIANHSWDHNHGVLDNLNVNDDSFIHIDDAQQCDQQIRQAQDYLKHKISGSYQTKYFAYPYGNYSDYLRYKYLPTCGEKIGLNAAFTTIPEHVSQDSQIWAMPRYVCNNDWKNTDQLRSILNSTTSHS